MTATQALALVSSLRDVSLIAAIVLVTMLITGHARPIESPPVPECSVTLPEATVRVGEQST